MRLLQLSYALASQGVEHVVVGNAAREHDRIVDSWADTVLIRLREAYRAQNIFEAGTMIPAKYFQLSKEQAELFHDLPIALVTATGFNTEGVPMMTIGGKQCHGVFRRNPRRIEMPLLDITGRIIPAVKTLTIRHILVHESEHFLDDTDRSLYPPGADRMDDDRKLEWFDRTTELNAMWRELKTSVYRLTDKIRKDLDDNGKTFTPAKVVALFSGLSTFPQFELAVKNSMLGIPGGNAIFEFGKTFHFQHLAKRVFSDGNIYRHKKEFEHRLRGLHRELVKWLADYKKAAKL